jgi:2-C-methyl-D-erythritol 4-phosphate cytidylyltransferase
VAAGRGDRLGGENPKAFAKLAGRPLLAESVERLDSSEWIEAIVIVAPEDWEEPAILLSEEVGAGKVTVSVPGGPTRADSVRLGLAEVPDDAAVVLVHDAARPLLPEAVVERVILGLEPGWDGVVPGVPVADTLKRVEGEGAVETVSRDGLVAVQTPQAFPASVLRSAAAAAGPGSGASDCSGLVEAAGGRVRVVSGDPRLLKITTGEDLALAEALLAADRGEP